MIIIDDDIILEENLLIKIGRAILDEKMIERKPSEK